MTKTTTQRKDTRKEVLNAARSLFARHGYEGVSMRDIANIVGIRQSGIYNHFASKQDILVELMVTHMNVVLADTEAKIKDIQDPTEALIVFVEFHVEYHIDLSDDVFLGYMELRSLQPEGFRVVRELRSKYDKLLVDILDRGVAAGQFTIENTAVHSRALMTMLTGVRVWYKHDGELTPEEVGRLYMHAVLNGTLKRD